MSEIQLVFLSKMSKANSLLFFNIYLPFSICNNCHIVFSILYTILGLMLHVLLYKLRKIPLLAKGQDDAVLGQY